MADFSTFHILPCYLDVIKRCVECTFATSDPVPDWNDVVFRKSVCELDLKPLWENCPVELRGEYTICDECVQSGFAGIYEKSGYPASVDLSHWRKPLVPL
ncbi:hypothetical protein BJY01DRAFT_225630 [Aspergillus pseudoustus]|uniref:Uncharacterized protein n=1 Tax=Aspergillus pseudoustus TaxID=1810923 RepID=A0ABR4IZ74_9EURO